MNKESKLTIMKNRLSTLEGTTKNIKCGGVVKALKREIRNLESEVAKDN